MLITALLLAVAAPSPAEAVSSTRAAFTKCLRSDLKKSLDAKKSPADYETAIKTVCQSERDAFRSAVIALDRASGDSQADAAEDADMQINDYHNNFIGQFKDYSESNTMPAD